MEEQYKKEKEEADQVFEEQRKVSMLFYNICSFNLFEWIM